MKLIPLLFLVFLLSAVAVRKVRERRWLAQQEALLPFPVARR